MSGCHKAAYASLRRVTLRCRLIPRRRFLISPPSMRLRKSAPPGGARRRSKYWASSGKMLPISSGPGLCTRLWSASGVASRAVISGRNSRSVKALLRAITLQLSSSAGVSALAANTRLSALLRARTSLLRRSASLNTNPLPLNRIVAWPALFELTCTRKGLPLSDTRRAVLRPATAARNALFKLAVSTGPASPRGSANVGVKSNFAVKDSSTAGWCGPSQAATQE
jgi:hypothetical protein